MVDPGTDSRLVCDGLQDRGAVHYSLLTRASLPYKGTILCQEVCGRVREREKRGKKKERTIDRARKKARKVACIY